MRASRVVPTCRRTRRLLPSRRLFSSSHSTKQPCPEVTVEDASLATDLVRPFFGRQEPLVLRQLLQASPKNRLALQNFKSWDYWERTIDSSTDCQVEIGGNYSTSPIADVPFSQFVAYLRFFEERFGRTASSTDSVPTSDDLIYLAQNDVFAPVLSAIEIPALGSTLGSTENHYSTMLWMGPHGCVSPLHYDPLDNLLMQYVGAKRVHLCPPGSHLPAGHQKNTSTLDPEKDDTDIVFQETTLHPGDALYIPSKWYHHVRTVETSVSVNTWFR